MQGTSDVRWFSTLRQCRNAASRKNINQNDMKKEINSILQLLETVHLTTKSRANLESLLEYIILNSDIDWMSRNLENESILHELVLKSPSDLVLMSLLSALGKLSTGSRQELCLLLLEGYFKEGRFSTLVTEKSTSPGRDSEIHEQTTSQNLLTALNSLPNRVANNTMGKFSDLFHHELFFQLLAIQTGEVIEHLVKNIRNERNISVKFISLMIGLFCFSGKADAYLGVILLLLTARCSTDYVLRKISQKIFATIPERHMEATITYVIQKLPWSGCMKWLLGDLIVTNKKLKFLLLHKLLLVKHFSDPRILHNIIGYIADDTNTKHLLLETLEKLFSVWSDSSAIKHVSYEQHKYVTQAILVCSCHLTKEQQEKYAHDIRAWLAPGMSCHLDASDPKVRQLGMIVGEVISEKTDFKGDNRLEFGFTEDDESKALRDLSKIKSPPTKEYFENLMTHHQKTKDSIVSKVHVRRKSDEINSVKSFTTSKATFLKVISSSAPSEIVDAREEKLVGTSEGKQEEILSETDSDDDDDDLQPYDMSNDTVFKKVKPPTYIRDCMEGLMEREEREKVEVCLGAAKGLIRKNPTAAREISIELCKILLVLDDTFALDNFTILRMSALTELVVVDPEPVAGYLTREFYEENYCLQHRLDILDVLTAAAKTLSSVERDVKSNQDSTKIFSSNQTPGTVESWRDVVDKRIEAKTMRFGKKRKQVTIPKENKFGPVAGCFFYPLLAGYDKRVRTMDLLGTDAVVLGRLLYSIGTIVYSAINTMSANSMSKSLLEFMLEMRFHSEAYVRQAVLFCVCMATITAGKNLLGLDVTEEIIEWVDDVMLNDPNEKTKHLAAQTAMTMKSCFCKDFTIQS